MTTLDTPKRIRAYNLNIDPPDILTELIGVPLSHEMPANGQTFLHDLAREGDILTAEIILDDSGAVDQPDIEGKRPLHEAAFFGRVEMIAFLIDCGATVDAPIPPFGQTPLYFAVAKGHHAAARLLLQRGADVHVIDRLTGHGLLHLAAQEGDARMAGILIEHGINVLWEDRKGQTARDYAVRNRHIDLERILLKVMAHHAMH